MRLHALIILAATLLLPCPCAIGAADADPTSEPKPPTLHGEPLPEPDLDTLAKRCHPDMPYDENNTAFEELIYLRDRPNPAAMPVLKAILEQSRPNKRIFEFAALQALYTLNTKESLALLDKTMKSSAMHGQTLDLIGYTFTWEMDPKQAAGLIEGYCLKSSGKDITLTLGLDEHTAKGGGIGIDVYFTNTTQRNLVWYDERSLIYFPRGLLLRDKQGRYYAPYKTVAIDAVEPVPTQTGPNKKTIGRRIVMYSHKKPEDDNVVWVLTRNMAFDLPAPGEYEAVYMFESPPMNEQQRAAWSDKTAAYWSGRVVSEPMTITVPEPKPDTRPMKPTGIRWPEPGGQVPEAGQLPELLPDPNSIHDVVPAGCCKTIHSYRKANFQTFYRFSPCHGCAAGFRVAACSEECLGG